MRGPDNVRKLPRVEVHVSQVVFSNRPDHSLAEAKCETGFEVGTLLLFCNVNDHES